MNREIKFRAWDIVNKRMYSNPLIYFIDGESFYWKESVGSHGSVRSDLEVILIQYTGLKDKNGKEIYEGDIVRYWWKAYEGDAQGEMFFEVTFIRAAFIFKNRNGGYSGNVGFFEAQADRNSLEVLGNIHENPELLK